MKKTQTPTTILHDLVLWWRYRTPQLRALGILTLILAWMSLEIWQGERRSRALIVEVRQRFQRQEVIQQGQFAGLLCSLEASLPLRNEDEGQHRAKLEQLERMIHELAHVVDKAAAP